MVSRRSTTSTSTGKRGVETIFASAASGRVIHSGTASGRPSVRRTT